MADPAFHALTVLRRLRRMETDAARRDLGEALMREQTLSEREAAIAREMDEARRRDVSFDRDSFSAWFARMLMERAGLADAIREAASHTAATRAALTRHRLAETAVEEALARRVAEQEAATARLDQASLEEIARATRQPAR